MNLPSPARALSFFLFSLGVSACGAAEATSRGPAPSEPPEVSRELAVDMARSDAARHFQVLSVVDTAAHQAGRYWVVELRTQSGRGLRYAISRQDGSIRQRASFQ
jgi:hypothetical protein